ncbi:MAG: hypothetical protein LBR80_04995 [Deltaproteobacteria bacterium]|jgi:hypothetical protein|nr:hypothetical protein [Deltaproteobacteria bacterium]
MNPVTRYKSVIIAWLVFNVAAFILFAVMIGENLTFVKFAAFFAMLAAGAVAAASLILSASPFQGSRPAPLLAGTAGVAAIVYVPVASAVSLVFMTGAASGLLALILLHLSLAAVFIAASAGIYLAAKRKAASDAAVERRAAGAFSLLSRAESIMSRLPQGSPEARSLERSVEEIRYFDKNSSVPADREIAERLMDLAEIIDPRPAAAPAPSSPPSLSPEDSALASLEAAVSGGAPPPAEAPRAPVASAADPAARMANTSELLEELYRLTLRRKDESLNSKRGSL